jgi:hypothetical protein
MRLGPGFQQIWCLDVGLDIETKGRYRINQGVLKQQSNTFPVSLGGGRGTRYRRSLGYP